MVKHKVKLFLTKLRYRGRNYLCPVCGYGAKKFLSAGLYVKRLNEKCPSCGSQTRHRHLWLFLEDYLTGNGNVNVLHFSPEKPIETRLRSMKGIRYVTSQYDAAQAADLYLYIQDINLPDSQFDLIICSHVLEHIPDDRRAMKEMFRILKPGGCALIMVPMWPSERHPTYENASITDERDRILHFGQFDHLRIYGLDIKDRLQEAGFSVQIIDMENRVGKTVAENLRLHNNLGIRELIFYSRKEAS